MKIGRLNARKIDKDSKFHAEKESSTITEKETIKQRSIRKHDSHTKPTTGGAAVDLKWHEGRDEDVDAHVKLFTSNEVRVLYVSLTDVVFHL